MQFRIRTLFVIVTILALALTLSSQSEPVRRVGLLATIGGIWLGCGLLTQSLCAIHTPIRLYRLVLVLASLVVTSAALSAAILTTALVLQDQFQGPPATP